MTKSKPVHRVLFLLCDLPDLHHYSLQRSFMNRSTRLQFTREEVKAKPKLMSLHCKNGDTDQRALQRILSHNIHEEVEPHDGHSHTDDWNLIEFCRVKRRDDHVSVNSWTFHLLNKVIQAKTVSGTAALFPLRTVGPYTPLFTLNPVSTNQESELCEDPWDLHNYGINSEKCCFVSQSHVDSLTHCLLL